MNVKTLQLFLQTLLTPIEACGTSNLATQDLQRVTQALENFGKKSLEEFAVFLERARQYEEQGHWPLLQPSIAGEVVDQAMPDDYAKRLTKFLQRHVEGNGKVSAVVFKELKALRDSLKAAELREVAKKCGIMSGVSSANAPKVIEKIFEHLTGQNYAVALINTHKTALESAQGDEHAVNSQLAETTSALDANQLVKLAKQMVAVPVKKSKSDAEAKIRQHLLKTTEKDQTSETRSGEDPFVTPEQGEQLKETTSETNKKLDQIVETIRELKSKASPDDAPYDEIEEELARLEQELDKDEAIEIAKRLGVTWSLSNKAAAMREIREEVFEQKLAREKIDY
ncbi:MAG: hypothetical protein ACFCD0_22555 [Gemmataceae bacterium]